MVERPAHTVKRLKTKSKKSTMLRKITPSEIQKTDSQHKKGNKIKITDRESDEIESSESGERLVKKMKKN